MAIYNLTNLTEAQNIVEITNSVNQLSGDAFGAMFIMTVWVIVFSIAQLRGDYAMAVTTASYVTSIMAFFAVGVGFLPVDLAWIPSILLAIGIVGLLAARE